MNIQYFDFADDFKDCVRFHGHLCPGLVYGYLVAKESEKCLGIKRAGDEEIVAISENDSCAVDALQVVLGTTSGKGNLIINNYGKNAFVIFCRNSGKAFRFAKKVQYNYSGGYKDEFEKLERTINEGNATAEQIQRQKYLKALDLLSKDFRQVFTTAKVDIPEPAYAELAESAPCADCGELTMSTKMRCKDDKMYCIPCFEKI